MSACQVSVSSFQSSFYLASSFQVLVSIIQVSVFGSELSDLGFQSRVLSISVSNFGFQVFSVGFRISALNVQLSTVNHRVSVVLRQAIAMTWMVKTWWWHWEEVDGRWWWRWQCYGEL